ncbi:MAG: N-acetylneuraminate synthase family protein [Methylocystaceae bacterium]|nr:N-acetylneuraminate synthase family protein [Methylocystaceae bacterium]
MTPLILGEREISPQHRPYLIAEIGVNHEGSLDQARHLIDLCKEGGADAAKFQTYKASRITSKNSPAYWDTSKEPTESQYKLFQKYDMFGPDEYISLARHCQDIEIDFLSTPFDADAIDFIDPLVSFHKVASADITNIPLLRQIAKKGKPVLLSTGASTLGEIDTARDTLNKAGCSELVLLHCVLNYPCLNRHAHLNMIESLQRAHPDLTIGYSDHTVPDDAMRVLSAAWLKGALVLEKHFTHDKTLSGNDHYHAMDVHDLKRFQENVNILMETLGNTIKKPLEEEAPARLHARRSIVIDRPLKKGHQLVEADLTYKRPAHGISPLHWDEVIGRQINKNLDADNILRWEDLA